MILLCTLDIVYYQKGHVFLGVTRGDWQTYLKLHHFKFEDDKRGEKHLEKAIT